MFEYKIEVKPWMLKSSSEDFTFMQKFNKDIPMPLMIMYTGGKVDETAKMIKLNLHGDIKQRVITHCMMCGRPITNKVSQYFGIGPICGGHNYTHPFDTEEEYLEAIENDGYITRTEEFIMLEGFEKVTLPALPPDAKPTYIDFDWRSKRCR